MARKGVYPQAAPKEQFAFVININRCIGCQTCTMACKSTRTFSKGQEHMWWTNVETKPYGGYPQHWDLMILDLLAQANPDGMQWVGPQDDGSEKPYGELRGKTVFEAPEFVARGDQPNHVLGYLPTEPSSKICGMTGETNRVCRLKIHVLVYTRSSTRLVVPIQPHRMH